MRQRNEERERRGCAVVAAVTLLLMTALFWWFFIYPWDSSGFGAIEFLARAAGTAVLLVAMRRFSTWRWK